MGHDPHQNREVSIFDKDTHIQFMEHQSDDADFYVKVDPAGVPISLRVEDKVFTLLRGEDELQRFIYDDVIEPKFNTEQELIDALFDIIKVGVSSVSYGEAHMQDNVTDTAVALIDTPVKVLGITTAGLLSNFIHTNNRIAFTGLIDTVFTITATISAIKIGGGVDPFTFYIAKNGVIEVKSHIGRELDPNGGAIALSILIELSKDDYVEVWAENNGSNADLRVTDMNLNARDGMA